MTAAPIDTAGAAAAKIAVKAVRGDQEQASQHRQPGLPVLGRGESRRVEHDQATRHEEAGQPPPMAAPAEYEGQQSGCRQRYGQPPMQPFPLE